MNPLQTLALGFFIVGAIWAVTGLDAAHAEIARLSAMRETGPLAEYAVGSALDDLRQYGYMVAACLAGILGTSAPTLSAWLKTIASQQTGKSTGVIGWIRWFAGLSTEKTGNAGQIVETIKAAISDSDHQPNYVEAKLWWDNGTVTTFVHGTPPGTPKAPPPTQQQAPPPPKPAPAPPAPSTTAGTTPAAPPAGVHG